MEFNKVVKERTATRKFSDKKIEKEKLEKILEIGRLAPSAKNLQPIKIYVVESNEGLNKIDKATPCRYNAKTCLIVCGDKNEAFHNEEFNCYEMDACIVATHLMLGATNEGVDNVWIKYFDENILRNEFNIPNNIAPVCLIPMGYRAEDCPENQAHNQRKNINEIVEYK